MELWGTDVVENYNWAVTNDKFTFAETELPFDDSFDSFEGILVYRTPIFLDISSITTLQK